MTPPRPFAQLSATFALAAVALASADAEAACPDLEGALATAEATIVEARFEATEAALDATEGALACGKPATPVQIARMWITEGTMLQIQGDAEGAADSYAAARRTAPDYWTADFGPKLEAAFRAAPAPEGATSNVVLTPALVSYHGWLDGQAATFPATVPPGLHLVQVQSATEVVMGRIVYVPPGQTVNLATNVVEVAAPVVTPPVVTPPVVTPPVVTTPVTPTPAPVHRAVSPGLVVGGVGVVGAAIAFGVSASQTARYSEAQTIPELDAVKNTQIASGIAGIGLAAIGAGGLLVHVAF